MTFNMSKFSVQPNPNNRENPIELFCDFPGGLSFRVSLPKHEASEISERLLRICTIARYAPLRQRGDVAARPAAVPIPRISIKLDRTPDDPESAVTLGIPDIPEVSMSLSDARELAVGLSRALKGLRD